MHKRHLFVVAALVATTLVLTPFDHAASSASGENVVVRLTSGEAFEGVAERTTKKHITYKTALGKRKVDRKSIESTRDARDVRQRYEAMRARIKPDDLAGHDGLLQWCLREGYTSGLVAELSHLLTKDPLRTSTWDVARRVAPHADLTRRNPHPRDKVKRWQRKETENLWDACRKTSVARAALVSCQLDALPLDLQMTHAVRYADRGTKTQRWIATRVLRNSKDSRRVKPLYRRALTDPIWQVRRQAVEALKANDDGTTYRPFVRALLATKLDPMRVAAADALGQLGDKRAVGALVLAMKRADGLRVAPHNNNYSLNQVAYVKDYDVEVAQTAFIADPLVDIVQDGMVHDVAVIALTAQRGRFAQALRSLTGIDHGIDPKAWTSWYKANREQYRRQ